MSRKAAKVKERELKAWEKSLNAKSKNLSNVCDQLAAARVTVTRLEYELKQQKISNEIKQQVSALQFMTTHRQNDNIETLNQQPQSMIQSHVVFDES